MRRPRVQRSGPMTLEERLNQQLADAEESVKQAKLAMANQQKQEKADAKKAAKRARDKEEEIETAKQKKVRPVSDHLG
jgi:hypothetical protein